jgi:hypothetical protein
MKSLAAILVSSFLLVTIVCVTTISPGCTNLGDSYKNCRPIPQSDLDQLPEYLSQTGLFTDTGLAETTTGVREFQPSFVLWSDGAEKRRWMWLPKDTQINSAEMDAWQFPMGTKLWKEFSKDGKRIETRLLLKIGPGPEQWTGVSYIWMADGTDAVKSPGGQDNALNTTHDVPSATQCFGCHGGTKSRILGFSAIQLSHNKPGVTLKSLSNSELISHLPLHEFKIPGDANTQKVLGYLHANCAHCHNQNRPASSRYRCYDPRKTVDFSLLTHRLARVDVTPTYRTAINSLIQPGDVEHSKLIRRLEDDGRFLSRMPPLGTEYVDHKALENIKRWIRHLEDR